MGPIFEALEHSTTPTFWYYTRFLQCKSVPRAMQKRTDFSEQIEQRHTAIVSLLFSCRLSF